MGIENWSATPASNNSAPPDGAPEGMAPSTVNDIIRQQMANHRSKWEDAKWFNWGHTPTRTGNTTFTVAGDQTALYTVGRRIKCTDATTIYGTIVSSSYSAPNTTITIHSDSGNLSASLSTIYLSIDEPTNISIHANLGRKGSDIASATTTDLSTTTGDFVDVTGTTAITALGTMAAGVEKTIRFTGALTLTYNATSLILPSAANITTVSGDVAVFKSLGSGNWQCINYMRASGTSVIGSGIKGADIASATTTDLSTATGDFVDITGTTTITSFGTASSGVEKTIRFTGALTLTYNATSLILPGAANITTVSGDTAIFRSLGSGNWVCISYQKADGQVLRLQVKGSDIASATTTDLSTATGDFVDVTGTTTITALGTMAAGVARTLRFKGALTLTHNATSLILPGATSITTVSGDTAIFRSLGSGNWQCISYQKANGIGSLVQFSSSATGAVATGSTVIPADDTIPQNTEGTQFMSANFTPKSASNTLVIDVIAVITSNTANAHPVMALFQDTNANALAATTDFCVYTNGAGVTMKLRYVMTAGSTSLTTFKVRIGPSATATLTFNGAGGTRFFNGVCSSSIVISEISP